MQDIKDLLEKPKANYLEWFEKAAHLLMGKYVIEAGPNKNRYRLLEIEFYYYSEDHKDETTYGYTKNMSKLHKRVQRHKLAQRNQLTWFIHYSGIDISIGDENSPGGILIRAIQDIKTKEVIKGPLVVLLELMNQRMSIDGSGTFQLSLIKESVTFTKGEEIEQQKRIGINVGGYENQEYNFFVSSLIKRTGPLPVKVLFKD